MCTEIPKVFGAPDGNTQITCAFQAANGFIYSFGSTNSPTFATIAGNLMYMSVNDPGNLFSQTSGKIISAAGLGIGDQLPEVCAGSSKESYKVVVTAGSPRIMIVLDAADAFSYFKFNDGTDVDTGT